MQVVNQNYEGFVNWMGEADTVERAVTAIELPLKELRGEIHVLSQ